MWSTSILLHDNNVFSLALEHSIHTFFHIRFLCAESLVPDTPTTLLLNVNTLHLWWPHRIHDQYYLSVIHQLFMTHIVAAPLNCFLLKISLVFTHSDHEIAHRSLSFSAFYQLNDHVRALERQWKTLDENEERFMVLNSKFSKWWLRNTIVWNGMAHSIKFCVVYILCLCFCAHQFWGFLPYIHMNTLLSSGSMGIS